MNFQEKYDEYKQRREAKKFFNQNNDIVIPWQNIKCIGDDLILVEI